MRRLPEGPWPYLAAITNLQHMRSRTTSHGERCLSYARRHARFPMIIDWLLGVDVEIGCFKNQPFLYEALRQRPYGKKDRLTVKMH
jgi:hypothetical protein